MNPDHLPILVCPVTLQPLTLEAEVTHDGRVREGVLREPRTGAVYPVRGYIPRFVVPENYARSFGVEWGVHRRTQYDEQSGTDVSRARFENETGWERDLSGKTILEVGSGSGRFTREALRTGARVVSVDLSGAVDANYESNGADPGLLIVQADVAAMPFRDRWFSHAFCFGVLQHTPDPEQAFRRIVAKLAPGGRIASDVYIRDMRHWLLQTKYWVRPLIDRRDPEKLYRRVERYVNLMWPVARVLRRIPRIGAALNWKLLVADYSRLLPGAPDSQLLEWACLDTFDMLSPEHDRPQTVRTFRRWHVDAGLVDVDVRRGYNGVEGRGRKPAARSDGDGAGSEGPGTRP